MDGDQAQNGFAAAGLAEIPKILQGAVDAGDLAGVVTLVWRKGEVVQVNATGYRDLESRAPMTRDTMFRIASMTKPVTSVAALMLMEEGKLKLDDPITRWIPELANLQVLRDPSGPIDDTYPAERDITVNELLTHRGGLAYAFSASGPLAQEYEKRLGSPLGSPQSPNHWLKQLGTLPLMLPPGQTMHYSHASEVLGFLVARIEGKTLGEVLQERIFGPLGMKDTAFWCPPEKRERMAKLYRMDSDTGKLVDNSMPHSDDSPAFEAGGGGLISTADDYLRFARMLLGKGEVDGVRLLKPQTVETMTANHLTNAQLQQPFLGMPYWMSQGFGLGVSVITDAEKHAWMGAGSNGSFGWPGAFGTWWQADPAEDLIAIFLIQDSLPLSPGSVSGVTERKVAAARAVQPAFLRAVYAALGR